jgi:alpha-L-fucosidase
VRHFIAEYLKYVTHLFLVLLAFGNSILLVAQEEPYVPEKDPLVQKKLDHWQDLKFGFLMHWGAYSQWGIVES